MALADQIAAFKSSVSESITIKTLDNSITPSDVGGRFSDLSDILLYISSSLIPTGSISGSNYIFNNGLTNTSGTVGLSGILSTEVDIDTAGKGFFIFNSSNLGSSLTLQPTNANIGVQTTTHIGTIEVQSANTSSVPTALIAIYDLVGDGGSQVAISPESMLVADTLNSIGFVYQDNYVANNISNSRWIPDKGYVDAAISGGGIPYTFSNGLTNISGAVKLGGPLTGNVAISNPDGYTFSIGDLSFPVTGSYLIVGNTGADLVYVDLTGGSEVGLEVATSSAHLKYQDSSIETDINVGESISIVLQGGGIEKQLVFEIDASNTIFKDDTNFGFAYNGDYSLNNATNSLWIPNSGWVKSQISSSSILEFTTNGSSGASTFVSGVLNIPVYPGGGGGISLSDLSAALPIIYDSGSGHFSFNSSSFLKSSNPSFSGTLSGGNIGLTNIQYLLFNGNADTNWRMGYNLGAYSKQITSSSLDIVVGTGSTDGFSIGGTSGSSFFEIKGSDNSVYIQGILTTNNIDNYLDNFSSSYTNRTKIDKGYADATYSTLTSSISSFVPYTGSLGDLDLNGHTYSTTINAIASTVNTGLSLINNTANSNSMSPSVNFKSINNFTTPKDIRLYSTAGPAYAIFNIDYSSNDTSWNNMLNLSSHGIATFYASTGHASIFDFTNNTDDRIYTLPDKSGTIALLSDITGGGSSGITSLVGDIIASGTGSVSASINSLYQLTNLTNQGTIFKVLHGNAAGTLSYGFVSLLTDVSGTLPVTQGGTGITTLTGLVKANGTGSFTAASGNLDYQLPIGYIPENSGSKATDFTTLNNILYPTTLAVKNLVNSVTSSFQSIISGSGFVKASGSVISYDNSVYLTTASASILYQPTGSYLTNTVASSSYQPIGSYLTIASASALYQPIGNYITALTGDGTASGSGSVALTLATVNTNTGSFGSASSVATFSVNGKGLTTAAGTASIQISESQVTNLTTDLANKQAILSGSGFVKVTGTTVSYDNNTYLTTVSASSIYAPLLNANLSGSPVAPTAVTGTNSTQIATTAFVQQALSGSTIYFSNIFSGSGASGSQIGIFTDTTVTSGSSNLITSDAVYRALLSGSGSVISGGFANPMTTVGDLIVGSTSGNAIRLGIGTTGQYLRVTSGSGAWTTILSSDLPSFFPDPTYFTGSGASTGSYFTFITSSIKNLASSSITLTTSGSSGTASFINGVLNIPNYSGSGGSSSFTSPITSLGDLIIGDATGSAIRLAIGTSGQYLRVTSGSGVWSTILSTDLPSFFPDPTYFTGSGASTGSYFTLLSSSIHNLFTGSTGIIYTSASGIFTLSTTQSIGILSNLSTNGSIQTTGSNGTLIIVGNTGTGLNVLATSSVLVTPTLGVATATSINKVNITQPATSASLTLVNGSTLTTAGAFNLTLTTTAASTPTFPTGTGTLVYISGSNAWSALQTFNGGISIGLAQSIGVVEGTGGRVGQTALVAGTKAITVTGITTSSRAFITLVTPGTTSLTTAYQAVCTSNTLTLRANIAAGTINTADTSTLNYLIIN